nr:aminotransferase class V-fold PLP-dependent enzyme [Paenibacillus polymyxa]
MNLFYTEHGQNLSSTLGVVTSGGTVSNLTALWIARNVALRNQDTDVERDGYALALHKNGYQRGVIIGSSLMHYSFDKAADVLGLGSDGVIRIDCDSRGRIDLVKLEKEIKACQKRGDRILALIGIAGTTESGAIDPLLGMAELARTSDIHFHVDAAWGGPLLMSDVHARKLRGIERANTVTIDGHKQMYLPMGIGILLIKDPHAAARIEKTARYILRGGSLDLGRHSMEGSRSAMSVYMHAGLYLLGREGYGYLLDEGIRKTHWMAKLLASHPAFELIGEPEINILTYRYIPASLREAVRSCTLRPEEHDRINRFNELLQEMQSQQGDSFVSRTTLCGIEGMPKSVVVLRVILANPLTTEAHIQSVLKIQQEIAKDLELSFEYNTNR